MDADISSLNSQINDESDKLKDIEKELESISSSLDHILLNDCQEFLEENPTPENIAKFFYNKLITNIPDLPLYQVEVEQSKGYSATFRP